MINIALYQPDIPQNTAAIIRICACFDINLEIIKPCGYFFDKKKLDRIYLDYLDICNLRFYESYDDFFSKKKDTRLILLTTKSDSNYTKFLYKKNDTLVFGKESAGVPEEIHNSIQNKLTIKMNKKTRSFNIASSVAIVASEALRQINL
ncbi:tRNA (cytidine(34)-2'-O)-methyltransferase [Pelagibacteraceae bacterium]|jgi:tRNA (cytidine/uridine-2'-O-)-methyltransferase|uniref:tRNA (cytidine(34)-2'-O)-methyltransferase n=1 Tax=Pelagibacter sp. (strain IMCC9063) TaxID=1002672 RepID=UPI000204648D|nr:tRNA (cytidine(34)-2'-O)-methyltransferase [Candidatus Pelagibacter sp. IMCC9063]AEA81188.1 rRNA Methylase [Candidatus Pelagibacter sp. IMCC9063]MDB4023158.1 tRNA (cytidine(34)-2'-O)-methyltransferase [Pelagibacteraceae bacterium]